MAPKWSKKLKTVQEIRAKSKRPFILEPVNLLFLGWSAYTFYIIGHIVFQIKLPLID